MKPFDATTSTIALTASTQERRKLLLAGEAIVFPIGPREQRVINAEWIEELGGTDGTFTVPIRIANAVIRGPLSNPYAVFKSLVSIVQTEFRDDVDLRGARFERAAIFRASHFLGDVTLSQIDVAYDLRLVAATFEKSVDLHDAHIGQVLFAPGVYFGKQADFVRMHVEKAAFFTPIVQSGEVRRAHFGGPALFVDARFDVTAEFDGASFHAEADFTRASFGAEAFFRRATQGFHHDRMETRKIDESCRVFFARRASFVDAKVAGALAFDESDFLDGALLDLRGTRIDELSFTGSFNAQTDFRGATVQRISGDWALLLDRVSPFTRDAYDCVERYLRTTSDERRARDVYYERRMREGQQLRQRVVERMSEWDVGEALRDLPRAIFDWFERFVCSYGVRSTRLFVATAALLLIGLFVFVRDGSLVAKSTGTPGPKTEEQVVYSVALAIPLVQLPPVERWRPTADPVTIGERALPFTYETFASLYRLLGFLFVPLAVAVVTGLLYRRERA